MGVIFLMPNKAFKEVLNLANDVRQELQVKSKLNSTILQNTSTFVDFFLRFRNLGTFVNRYYSKHSC